MRKYNVSINGKKVKCERARVSAIPFNQVWCGYQRSKRQTELSYFVNYCGELPAVVKVKVIEVEPPKYSLAGKPYSIKPQSKNIKVCKANDEYVFALTENGSYTFDNDTHENLTVFVSSEIEQGNATYTYTKGIYYVGKLNLNSNESVFIGKDAVVYGCIYADNAHDIRIYGNGILDDRQEQRASIECYNDDTIGTLKLYNCTNVKIEGIILRDSAIWVVNLFACNRVIIDNIKIIGHYKYNTDGIDIVNSSNVKIINSYIRAFDDGITLKAIDKYAKMNVENIHVENCVLWCGWGRTLEIGLETGCEYMRNISFINCDLICNSAVSLDIQNGDYAIIENVLFKNIRVCCDLGLKEIYQRSKADTYPQPNLVEVPKLIAITNCKYNLTQDPILNKFNSKYGQVKNIVFKDIYAFGDNVAPKIVIEDCESKDNFSNISFENISFNNTNYNIDNIKKC